MKFNFNLAAIALVYALLVGSCTKDNSQTVNQDNKEVKVVRRDFTKGIMTIEFTDGTKNISKIPIDSSAFHLAGKKSKVARTGEDEYVEWAELEDKRVLTPIWNPDSDGFLVNDLDPVDGVTGYVGPLIWTRCHVILDKADGVIVGYGPPWVEITKNKNVTFTYKGGTVYRTAEMMDLIFIPGLIGVPVAICEWEYYINFYFTYSFPYRPPQTKQIMYDDIKFVQ